MEPVGEQERETSDCEHKFQLRIVGPTSTWALSSCLGGPEHRHRPQHSLGPLGAPEWPAGSWCEVRGETCRQHRAPWGNGWLDCPIPESIPLARAPILILLQELLVVSPFAVSVYYHKIKGAHGQCTQPYQDVTRILQRLEYPALKTVVILENKYPALKMRIKFKDHHTGQKRTWSLCDALDKPIINEENNFKMNCPF